MELSSPEGPRRRFIETKEPDVGQVPVEQGRRHRAIVETMFSSTSDAKPSLLAPLAVGDRLPWKLDREGEPQCRVRPHASHGQDARADDHRHARRRLQARRSLHARRQGHLHARERGRRTTEAVPSAEAEAPAGPTAADGEARPVSASLDCANAGAAQAALAPRGLATHASSKDPSGWFSRIGMVCGLTTSLYVGRARLHLRRRVPNDAGAHLPRGVDPRPHLQF